MRISFVIGGGLLLIGAGAMLAATAQVVRDLADYGRTNFGVQFPYPDGPPLGGMFLISFGIILLGVIALLLPRALASLPLRD